MVWKSLSIDGVRWRLSPLTDRGVLLSVDPGVPRALQEVWRLDRLLRTSQIEGISDIIPAFDSIALRIRDDSNLTASTLEQLLMNLKWPRLPAVERTAVHHELCICYEFGIDWEHVSMTTGLSQQQAIDLHQSGAYRVALNGFMPGFLYLEGLHPKLHCPRRADPRLEVPAGSVGIGGTHTGIYGLAGPGGWQLIGRTPNLLFNADAMPPVQLQPGDTVRFQRIARETFFDIQNKCTSDG